MVVVLLVEALVVLIIIQNWTGFGDITIDVGSGTTRTYNIKFKKNSGAQAYFRNGYLFAMEMKPN